MAMPDAVAEAEAAVQGLAVDHVVVVHLAVTALDGAPRAEHPQVGLHPRVLLLERLPRRVRRAPGSLDPRLLS